MSYPSRVALSLSSILLSVIVPKIAAESAPGVTSTSIRIGSCSALTGPASFLGIQTQVGALAYFHMVKDSGGVNGRTIELKSRDDGYDPQMAAECFNSLIKDDVFAMGFFVGTPTAAKYIPMAENAKVPVVGLFTGAQMLYEPFKHNIVNVRASYFDEAREQVDALWNQRGLRKIGVLYQNDAFGKTVLEGVQHALTKHDAAPTGLGTFERNTLQISEGLNTVRKARPDAVILVGPYAPVAAILKEAHASGWHPLFLTVSFVGTEGLVRAAGAEAEGVVITQVVPPYDRTDLPTIKLYRRSLDKYMSGTSPSFVSLEAFVDAMVFVEGLRAAGRELTREKLISGIESLHDWDPGLGRGFQLGYGPHSHKGFDAVYATVIRDGHASVINDWKTLKIN